MIILPDGSQNEKPDHGKGKKHQGGELSFPFRPDKNAVFDANGVPLCIIPITSIPLEDAARLARLFAASADMLALLAVCRSLLTSLATQNGLPHGTENETEAEKEQCPLCQIEGVIKGIQGT
jgi:hypothetical protein